MIFSASKAMNWERANQIAREAFRRFSESRVTYIRENQRRLCWTSEEQQGGVWLFKMGVFPREMMKLGELIKDGAEDSALTWVKIVVSSERPPEIIEIASLESLLAR